MKRSIRLVSFFLVFLLAQSSIGFGEESRKKEINYIKPSNKVITKGINVWHNNKVEGTTNLPLQKQYDIFVGKTKGQIVYSGDAAYVLAEDELKAIEVSTGRIIGRAQVNTEDVTNKNPFLIELDTRRHQIICPAKNEIVSFTAQIDDESISMSKDWSYGPVDTDTVTLLKDGNKSYIGIGSKDGKIIILDSKTGDKIINGELEQQGSLGMGITLENMSSMIVPGNNVVYDKGYFAGVHIVNGTLQADFTHNYKMNLNTDIKGLSPVCAYTKYQDIFTNTTRNIIFSSERLGTIAAYDPVDNKVLFKINRYEGLINITGFAVSGKYLLVTFESGKIAVIDFERAILDAQYHPKKLSNDTVVFEKELDGNTYTGSIIFRDHNEELFLTANTSDSDSLTVYYMDKYDIDSRSPIKASQGFVNGSSISVPGGIISQLTFSDGYLLFIDGRGHFHCYKGQREDNIIVTKIKNSHDLLEKGRTYEIQAEISNKTMKDLENIDVEFVIDDTHTYNAKLDLPKSGLKVFLEYMVPENYDNETLKIDFRTNANPNQIIETNYSDNIKTMILDVAGNIDLEVLDIEYRKYPVNRWVYSFITVKNNSSKKVTNIPVKFTIDGNEKVEKISLSKGMTTKIPFLFKIPDSEFSFEMSGEINHNRVYEEISYSNNKMTVMAESMESIVIENGKESVTWTEDRLNGQKHFWAKLEGEAILKPQEVKSGTGFEVVVTAKVTTNYDKPNLVTGAQGAYIEFDGKKYEMIGGGIDKEQSFMLPENHDSILYDNVQTRHLTRKIYLPVSLPDGDYKMQIVLFDAMAPGGAMKKEFEKHITVKGSMFENDYTKPK